MRELVAFAPKLPAADLANALGQALAMAELLGEVRLLAQQQRDDNRWGYRGLEMNRIWLAGVGALLIAQAAVMVATAPLYADLAKWLQDRQTLITGVIAVGAALATIEWMQRGIDESRRQSEEARRRDLDAARSSAACAQRYHFIRDRRAAQPL